MRQELRCGDQYEQIEDKDGNTASSKHRRHAFKDLFSFAERAHLLLLVPALLCAVSAGIMQPAIAVLFGQYFDSLSDFGADAINGDELSRRSSICVYGLLAVGTATCALKAMFFYLWLAFGEAQAGRSRETLFQHMIEKEVEWFETWPNGVHALLARIQTQVRELQMATSQPLGFICTSIFESIASVCVAFYHDWRLASMILGSLPIIVVVTGLLSRDMGHALDDQNNALENAARSVIHTINNILLVKCSNTQYYELGRFHRWALHAGRSYLRQAHMNAMQIGALRFASTAVIVGALYYGTGLIHRGQTSAGNVLTTFWACSGAAGAFEEIWPQLLILQRGCSAAAGLRAILDRTSEGNSGSESRGIAPENLEGDIEFQDVLFAYPSRPSHCVLRTSSLFFPAGETTFLVGQSGSGKSTIGALLLKFYSAYRGKISIDGRDLRNFDTGWLRNNITLVQQHSILFDETIFHNIALGRKDHARVSHGRIQDSIEFAMLHDSVSRLPSGVITRVGRYGSLLSGGQRQRVAIARAHLRDTPVLVLDESTSALDRNTMVELMHKIRIWRSGKTTIVITHDTSQIRQDDFVYVLRDGQVVAEGYRRYLHPSLVERGASGENESLADTHRRNSSNRTKKRSVVPGINNQDGLRGSQGQTALRRLSSTDFEAVHSLQDADGMRKAILSRLGISGETLHRARISDDMWNLKDVTGRHSVMHAARPMSMYRAIPMKPLYRQSERSELFGESRNPEDPGLIRNRNQHAFSPEPADHDNNTKSSVGRLSLWSVLSTIWCSLSIHQKLTFLLGFLTTTIHAASLAIFSYLLAQAMSTFYLHTGWQKKATDFALSMLGVAIGDGAACYLMHYCLEVCGQAWVTGCRIEAVKRITQQPAEWFDDERHRMTSICATLDQDAEETRNLLGRFAVVVYVVVVMMTVAAIWAIATCWKLALVGLACACSMLLSARWFGKVSSRWEARTNNEGEVVGTVFAEAFGDIYTMRVLTLESYFHQRHAEAISKAFAVGLQRGFYEGVLFGISDSAIHFVTAAIFAYGAQLLRSGSYPVQSILQVLSLLIFSITHANSINSYIPQISLSIDTASRLLRLCQLPLQSHEHGGRTRLAKDNSDMSSDPICFAGQNFAYPQSPQVSVLSRLNLTISLNKCTAIVGASGSGKSTIASLLLGLYPPSGDCRPGHQPYSPATLFVSGLDIRTLDIFSLREYIAIVPQKSTIIAGTVHENILYGINIPSPQTPRPHHQPSNQTERDDSELIAATTATSIHDFILTLPSGYDTPLSPSDDPGSGEPTSPTSPGRETPTSTASISLSGGQAQRIAIARALARNPRILILDEPTSALDLETADEVRRGIKRYQQHRIQRHGGLTVVVITHSEEMMRWADEVVVLEAGRVVETGVYDELDMVARWRRREGADEGGKGKQRARDG